MTCTSYTFFSSRSTAVSHITSNHFAKLCSFSFAKLCSFCFVITHLNFAVTKFLIGEETSKKFVEDSLSS